MSSLRFALLLLIVGGLALFVLQNWTPALPLVILGASTQPLPLAFWMLIAIAAGAFTTIVIAGLFRITAFSAAPRPRRNRPNVPPRPSPSRPNSANSSYKRDRADDWGGSRDEWDDWDEEPVRSPDPTSSDDRAIEVEFRPEERQEDYTVNYRDDYADRPAAYSPPSDEPVFYGEARDEPPVYDAPYEVYRPPYRSLEDEPFDRAYEPPAYSDPVDFIPQYTEPEYVPPVEPGPELEQEVWDDWEEEPEDTRPIEPPEPQRPIVEVQQAPKTRYQSGTVYSYSYRGDEDEAKPPQQEESQTLIQSDREEEEWDFEDEDEGQSKRQRDRQDEDW